MNNSQQMLQALEEQDLVKAEHYFVKALENDPSDLLYELATYLEGIGFYPQAKEIYLKIVEDFPEVNLNLAAIASEDGKIEEAFAYLEEIQADSDWYVSALLLKADLYQLEGLTDVAREKLLEALTYSEDPLLILGLAELDSELENYQEAIQGYAQLDNSSMYTKNEEELINLGERLGTLLQKNDVLILSGELGAGKTTFTKGLAKGLGIRQMIKSPTYTIVREYEGRLPLYHLDVYRIEGDADSIDLDEFLFGGGVTVIEWGHLLGEDLPDSYLELELLKEAEGRCLYFSAQGPRAEQLIKELQNGV